MFPFILAIHLAAIYLWWDDNRAVAWIAVASCIAFVVTTLLALDHRKREAALQLRVIDVYAARIWGLIGWVTIICSTALLVLALI